MAEIYCKRCQHYEELGRGLKAGETCPACGSGVYRRKGKVMRPSTHFPSVLAAIFSLRGFFFLLFFSIMGTVPIGVTGTAAIIMLFLGSLRLAIKTMTVKHGDKIEFPEISPEELFDKSSFIPSFTFVILFVWLPPVLGAYGLSGVFSIDPAAKIEEAAGVGDVGNLGDIDMEKVLAAAATPAPAPKPTTSVTTAKAPPPNDDPEIAAAVASGQFDTGNLGNLQNIDEAALQREIVKAKAAKASTPAAQAKAKERTHMDAPRVAALVFGVFLFLWAPMALVLYLRTSSTLAMLYVPAGIATVARDVGSYFALCFFVLPALALRFGADVLTSALPFFATPPILFVKGAVVLFSWALCGLYVRQHARAFDLPVDDDDWMPHGSPGQPAPGLAPTPVVKGAPLK